MSKQNKVNAYWKKRHAEQERMKLKDAKEIEKEVNRIYRNVSNEIEKEINSFFAKYASDEGITRQEAKKRASKADVTAFESKAKQYVDEKNFSDKANKELKLYNLKLRSSRLELLQKHINLELVGLANDEETKLTQWKKDAFYKTYKDQAGILGMSVPEPDELERMMKVFIDKPYHGADFSERIWGRNNDINKWLDTNVYEQIIGGKNPREIVPDLKRAFDVTSYEAERLARTEQAFMSTEAQREAYEEGGVEWFDLIPESSACDECIDVAENGPYKVSEMQAGVNSVVHPNCLCSVSINTDNDTELLNRIFEANNL